MPKGPTKRRPQTRARLLEAAMDAFAEAGFGATSIDEICRRAGYTTGAYYSNFSSKDELFFALFDEHAAQALDRLVSKVAGLADGNLTPEEIAGILADLSPEERRWYLVSTEFTLYAMRNPEAAGLLADHDARARAELVRILTAYLTRMGRESAVDLDLLARLIIAIREGALLQSLVEPDALPTGTLEAAFLPTLLRSLFHA
ncbi:TetR/AcrR family transcriptional regulator [Streptomyces sp. SID13726]|uniref:TetR/AcrR family transcriptional regulator n=1 Tax=Streptomyces sp. SID13726 TaxID=2706058 RepID=UPI0013BAD62C|nr:TetR/AcrR family transcriptional regulator [Streptomyces sp. SID13726]NEB04188.1 TetR/AcrR family transcriptional regulator [Streptomyces sp. SID13726]